jgi:hypothetical protein
VKADPARRKRSQRRGRMKGCYVYIAAENLQAAGFDPAGPAPLYRVWGGRRGSLLVTLYRQA